MWNGMRKRRAMHFIIFRFVIACKLKIPAKSEAYSKPKYMYFNVTYTVEREKIHIK